ncbi:hypothetical protein EVAR_85620_1, partial [Eumeta japonica]
MNLDEPMGFRCASRLYAVPDRASRV